MSVQIIDANIIKKTQDSLGKIIKKPPMTEKLLSKPPFRFLHDVMTSVIKTTGFMNGLFTDTEMNSDNVKEKEAKIAFLQKVIDMISLVLGKTLSARPSRIISGSEPEKTNEMLQMLAEAINKKIDNDEYVQRVLRPDEEATKNKKESKHKRDEKDSKESHKKDSSPSKKERRHRSKTEEERQRDDDRHKKRDKSKHEDDERKKEPKKESRRHERSEERSKEKKDEVDKGGSERHRSRRHGDDDDDVKQERTKQSKREDGERTKQSKREDGERTKQSKREDGERTNKTVAEEERKNEMNIMTRPSSAKRPRQQILKVASSNQEIAKPPVSASKPRSIKPDRPSSARPAPPKPRRKEDTQEEISGKLNSNVIIDKKRGSDDDDDDDFIVKEDTNEQWMKQEAEGPQNEDIEGDHGILVKKILDTKKELETNTNYAKKTEIEHSEGVVEASKVKDRQLMLKEIEKIRSLIQSTTRNINPLGKTLDFLQEDMDSMLKEMNMWAEETKHNRKLLNEEMSKTEAILEPLKAQFKDLEISISEQLDQISAVKNNILLNDKKLNAMLASVMRS